MYLEAAKELLAWIDRSPTSFHAVAVMKEELEKAGAIGLSEAQRWHLEPGKRYYVTRNDSSIIAFRVGRELENYSFNIVASHSDSPTFKLKENAELEIRGHYTTLDTEGYGGMLCSTWFDRPLSLAGRAIVKLGDTYETKLVNIDRDLLIIPNVAIHMNREANNGFKYNLQTDLLPLLEAGTPTKDAICQLVSETLGVAKEDIYGLDLFLYNRMKPTILGLNNELIASGRLDDLQCGFTSMKAFIEGENEKSINVFACFDNEEVGSGTKQGAASTFLKDTLTRINRALGKSEEDYHCALASSFMISADNAHAVHPNHPEKTDALNCVYMNEGIVVKACASQSYTTDAMSAAVFKGICEKAGVPVQFFANRSDARGGGTLGNIQSRTVSINSVDIGLAQLAMHSAYEMAGVKDTYYMEEALRTFYSSHLESTEKGLQVTQ